MSETHAAPKHPYHLVDPSPWPIIGAVAAGFLTSGGVLYMHGYGWTTLIIGIVLVLGTMAVWWRDVIREATFQGYHTPVVQLGLRYGMALFIASEVMFFAAFFWAFFASSLFPVGGVWPPKTIHPFNPFEFPFLNTLILLLSGTTVTWAHHSLLDGDRGGLLRGLALTIFLGAVSMISYNAGRISLMPLAAITTQAKMAAQSSALCHGLPPIKATEIPMNAAADVSASLR